MLGTFLFADSLSLEPAGSCEEVASDLGLGRGFCSAIQFPPQRTIG